eukprot:sb/3463353/
MIYPRSLIRAVIISLLVAGPLTNITDNSLRLAKSIQCSAQLTVDQANSTAHATVQIMKQQMESVRNTSRSINDESEKMSRFADQEMVQILRSEDGAKGHLSPTEMYNQGANKCHRNTDGPRKRCESGMSNEMDKCNQIHEQNDGCNKETQNNAERTNRRHTDDIARDLDSIKKIVPESKMNIRSGHRVNITSTALNEKFIELMTMVDNIGSWVSLISQWLSVLLLGVVVIRSIGHQVRYLTKLSYLNDVVTTDLLILDRSLSQEHRVFPLPSYMKSFVRDGKRKFLTGNETRALIATTVKHLIFSMVFLVIMFLDTQVYGVLEDIADTGYIIYEVYIKLGVVMDHEGGKWTKNVMDNLSKTNNLHHLSFTQDNNRCLPDATPPDHKKRVVIGVFVLLTLLLNVLEIYSQRAVRRICKWFYPEREKKRVEFLYRFLKQRRLDCFDTLVSDKKVCVPRVSGLPVWFQTLLFFKDTCTICQNKKIYKRCERCINEGYSVMYCIDCWTDAKNDCVLCVDGEDDPHEEPDPFEELNHDPPPTLNKFLPLRTSFADTSSDEDPAQPLIATSTRTTGPRRKRPSRPR